MAQALIPVAEARARILSMLTPTEQEPVLLANAVGRILAEDVVARRTQPPSDLSAMDGYAVRAADVSSVPARLRVVGESPAGGAYDGILGEGEAVRIFTGAPVPHGADAIVIQEDTERYGDIVIAREKTVHGRNIRPAGLDFTKGTTGLAAGRKLSAADIAFAAAMNVSSLSLHRRPRIAFFSTGDELVRPGAPLGPNQIVSSNNDGLAALIAEAGGVPLDLGIAPDRREAIRATARKAIGADMLVTLGGASVGDHDLVQAALAEDGLDIDFWRIAMRPGKPLMFGRYRDIPMLGLPGNPVSAQVCALLFLVPALTKLAGGEANAPRTVPARLGTPLAENDQREDYLRAGIDHVPGELPVATPFPKQDSSMLSLLSAADCLIVRPPHAPAAEAGEMVSVIPLR
ncbi:molybdopterin molybdenumtransferase MoeA [Parvibaculum sedimenti]|uniref:Molybdopterin molybdenumtransferase n=1 Tax=Parvibaculum sedimenti TaxID=2608632 RepID=A0A6N6VGF2_9HYPH|nr:gephyrin-like molybdotransferase Glp [Parvibaculum sedimenti]KAB7739318.1 molybdopterin molybdenumtransferase MoeA [Parvibaculum sedimenti]